MFLISDFAVHLIKAILWVGENFPDDSELADRLLLGGTPFLVFALLPSRLTAGNVPWYFAKWAIVAMGAASIFLGAFVYFRRFVWNRQQKIEENGWTTLFEDGRAKRYSSLASNKKVTRYR